MVLEVSYLLTLGGEFDYLIALDGFNEIALYETQNKAAGVFPAFPRQWHIRAGRVPSLIVKSLMNELASLKVWRRDYWRRPTVSIMTSAS